MKRDTAYMSAPGVSFTITETAQASYKPLYVKHLSPEARKERIITELYKRGTLGSITLNYDKVKNPLRAFIMGCLYKCRLACSVELVDDCYNEAFYYLQKMTPEKICALYDESPAKLVATTFTIVSLKCFAIDPRYGNPRHSLIQQLVFTSSYVGSFCIDHCDKMRNDADDIYYTQDRGHSNRTAIQHGYVVSDSYTPEEFVVRYGTTIEDVLAKLNPDELATFYGMSGKQPRGKRSTESIRKRQELELKLRVLLPGAPPPEPIGRINPAARKFKGSAYDKD